jgi:chromosome segregation ATPase
MYQREVSRLGQTNNSLHLELMALKESASLNQEKWRVALRKLEAENSDLKALCDIHKAKCTEVEAERDAVKSRLDGLYNKVYNPASQKTLKDPALRVKKQNSLRKQEFKVAEGLEAGESIRGFTKSQQEWAQELQDSDERVKRYQEQVEELIKAKEELQEDLRIGEERLRNRDLEIERLSGILNSGEFAVKVPKRVAKETKEEEIRVLNERLDLVNAEYMRMEDELSLAKTRLAQVGNVHMERDVLTLKLDEANREIAKLTQVLSIGGNGKSSFETEKRGFSAGEKGKD